MFVHTVRSLFQAGETEIRVWLPERVAAAERLPVLYLLPVEKQGEHRFGDGMREAQRLNLAGKHRVICVAPTFSDLPWYADHPTDPEIRQESYLLKVVVPLVDRTYPTIAKAEGRLLVGFSKSGWGAFSLLLRHPDMFGKAAAWDAPLMMDGPGRFGTEPIFGTQENFEQYRIDALLRKRGKGLGSSGRLILTSYDAFREDHAAAHQLMNDLGVPHIHRDGPQRKHDWHSGWLAESVELLMADESEPAQP
ncbi:MAG: alpha/beta hydrolase-fold protein [Planctomycetaceae bacterium]